MIAIYNENFQYLNEYDWEGGDDGKTCIVLPMFDITNNVRAMFT